MLQEAGLSFIGREHNSLDDVSNCTRMLAYLDARGANVRPDDDQSAATLTSSKPLMEPLRVEISPDELIEVSQEKTVETSQEELNDMGQFLLCKEKFPLQK